MVLLKASKKKMSELPKKSPKDYLRNSQGFIKYTNIAFRMIVIILIGVFSGVKLDEYFEMETAIFTLALSLLSVAGSMYVIIREISSK